jgi:hypothetical protein
MHYTSQPGQIACLILKRQREGKLRKAFVEISRIRKRRLIGTAVETDHHHAKSL